jgi:hypothetical protein
MRGPMSDWAAYHAGDIVYCLRPPQECADRRGAPRGSDRRTGPRIVRPQEITRAGPGTMLLVRIKPKAGSMTLGLTQIQECPRCHTVLEIHVCADTGRAA